MTLKPPDGANTALLSDRTVNLASHGVHGDGTTDDTDAIDDVFDALPATGGHLYVPPGTYKITSALTCTGKEDLTIEFAGGAYLDCQVPSGDVLTFTSCHRLSLIRPRFRLTAGAPSAFLVIDGGGGVGGGSWDAEIVKPTIWSNINIPASCDGIVVKGGAYWADIRAPKIRKDSGTLTGTFRRGISFLTEANAGRVVGGSIGHCDDGVFNDDCNSVLVDGTAFEGCTDGVELSELSQGARIVSLRGESLTNLVNISQTTVTNFLMPITIGPHRWTSASVTNLLNNPNAVPVRHDTGLGVSIASPNQATQDVQHSLQAGDNQVVTTPLIKGLRRPTTGGEAFTLDTTGTIWGAVGAHGGYTGVGTDADMTLTPASSSQVLKHTGTLTANRAITLSTTNAKTGMTFRITRTGGGAFNLDVGTGPLKALATNQWCEVVYTGAAWTLLQFGSL